MKVRRVAAVAGAAVLVAGAYAPATAAPKKKPVTKSYSMQLLPVPDPPSGDSCVRPELENISMRTETLKTTGAGVLSVKVNGFSGDWDISVFDPDGLVGVGSGTTTGGGAPAIAGEDTFEAKFKKATTLLIRVCNFAGSLSANAQYTFTYK